MTQTEIRAQRQAIGERWVAHALSTEPANRAEAEAGVRLYYKKIHRKQPKIFWFDSPFLGSLAAARLASQTTRCRAMWNRTLARFGQDPLRVSSLGVYGLIGNFWHGELGWVGEEVRLYRQQVMSRVIADILSLDERLLPHSTRILISGYHEDHLMSAVFEADGHVDEEIDALGIVSQNAGWWWAFDKATILTERPEAIHRDHQNRLHNPTGPAVLFRDGYGVWAWHGVVVKKQVITAPQTITVSEIDRELNTEVRRVLVERYGVAEYVRDSGTIPIHQDDWGTLYRRELPHDEPLVMVKVVNSTREPDGTFKDYFLRIHPQLRPMLPNGKLGQPQKRTALNAVASTFGLTGREYLEELTLQT